MPNLVRSPELLDRQSSALLVVDVQAKLIGKILDAERIVWNCRRLLDGAAALGVRAAGTEQYPQGLGPTVPELAQRLANAQGSTGIPAKLTFSCGGCPELFEDWRAANVHQIVVVGIEAHVCVAQTVLDLMTAGFRVYVVVDAVGSRAMIDAQTAFRRLELAGAVLTTTEAVLFEWCEVAGTPEFKRISQLVREEFPKADPIAH